MHVPGWWAGAAADVVTPMLPAWVSELGQPGIITLVVILLLTDQLVPGRRLRKSEAENEKLREALAVKDKTIADLAETGRAAGGVLRAVKGALPEEVPPP
jgi:hypothetical protein